MNKKTLLSVSALALAVSSQFAGANPAELKQVHQQLSPANGKLSFAEWQDQQRAARQADITDQFIVSFSDTQTLADLRATQNQLDGVSDRANQAAMLRGKQTLSMLSKYAGQTVEFVRAHQGNQAILRVTKAQDMKQMNAMAKAMANAASVASAEPDPRRFPMAENMPWGISATQADLVSDSSAGNMTVCIIDSGYDISNSDLSGNQVSGTNDSGTGSWSTPGGSHGSHVAGTIAAINNNQGVVGVMPNQNVNLHIIKVFNESGWAYSSSLVSAIQKCDNAGAKVVNMSLGGASSSTSESNSMQSFYNNGILLVAAAGNDGDSTHSYPASYNAVMSVAAVDENGDKAEFSQYTSQVEISGPGVAVLSTVGVGDGRQGYLTVGSTTYGDDEIVPQTRFVQSGSNYVVSDINGTVSGQLATCSRSGSSYSCGNMSGKICVAERHANQGGGSYPEIDPVLACVNAGANGVVVYSNSALPATQFPFLVDGTSAADVPTVSVDRALGQQLAAQAGSSATLQVVGGTDYAYYNGTSMATPHVAGVAALAWSQHPQCTVAQVRSALTNSALDLDSSGRDNNTGWGMVQTQAAVNYMAANCGGGSGGGGGTGGGDTELSNGTPVSGLSAATNEELTFTMVVPEGATDLNFAMSGGSGDADLYVRFGSEPTKTTYDCRPYKNGNAESCAFAAPSAGTYHVKVIAYSSFSNVTLTGSFTEPSTGGGGGGATGGSASVDNISASRNNWNYYTIDVPQGMSTLTVDISGGSGDADLYVRFGSQPTTTSYDCRPYKSGNTETCTFNNPTAGTWHIGVRAYRAYSGVDLAVSYQP